MPPPMSFESRLYRAAIHLYPPAFRHEFSAEMVRDFDEARREPHVVASRRQLWAFRRRIAEDLIRSILIQWVRSGWPAIAALSLVGPLTSTAAATILVRPLLVRRARSADEELLVLVVLVTAVLVVVTATIIFTLCFAQPRLRRRP